jgi:putative nucleotidyltransferase with HDIG domain
VDPPLTAKVLRLANSAYFAPRITISEIDNAVMWIGFDALKELALRQKVCEVFNRGGFLDGYSRRSLWKHSVAVAMLAKAIYRREFREGGENVYAAGLLHDIGIIVLDQFMREEFLGILSESKRLRVNLRDEEERRLGYTHADIGMALAEQWNFPRDLTMTIGGHHNRALFAFDFAKMASTLYVADYLCQRRSIGYMDEPYPDEEDFRRCLRTLGVRLSALEQMADGVEEELAAMEEEGLL